MTKYSVLKSIGAGATSEVFSVRRLNDDKIVALKKFNALVTHDPDAKKRMELEAQTLRQLNHPNIVSLEGVVEENGEWALELEFVEGTHLSLWNQQYDQQIIEPKIWILAQIARGLGAAHEQEVLHRDLKPENILISKEGDVKITDFGLARSLSRVTVTRSGLLVGSLAYMAPEVINIQNATTKSDIFSFGVIAYELLTKQSPFPGDTPQGMIRAIIEGKAAPANMRNPLVSEKISEIIKSCLSPNPELRPQSIWHVEAELMSELTNSGLISFCKKAVSIETRSEVLIPMLQRKHESLSRSIQNKDLSTKSRISAANELQTLFPSDDQANQFLLSLQAEKILLEKQTNKKNKLALYLFICIAAVSVGFIFLSRMDSKQTEEHTSINSASVPSPSIPDAMSITASEKQQPPEVSQSQTNLAEAGAGVETAKTASSALSDARTSLNNSDTMITPFKAARSPLVPTKSAEEKKKTQVIRPKPSTGTSEAEMQTAWLTFNIPDDIDVFVGGQYVPLSQRNKFKVNPGKHLVKLVKQGFVPVENTVSVEAGKIATIRAGE